MRTTLSALAVLLMTAGAALAGPTAAPASAAGSAAAAAPKVDLRPGSLPRGAAPHVPYVDGTVVVDGARRLRTGADQVRLLGRSGTQVLVAVAYDDQRPQRVLRLAPDGTRSVVAQDIDTGAVALSDDGTTLVTVRAGQRRSTVRVLDTRSGATTATRRFRGYVEAHDVAAGRVLLVGYRPARTLVWRTGTDATRVILRRATGFGDFESDRLSWFTGDPYDGGCGVLVRLSAPRQRVWRSCRDVVTSISPDGSRMVTVHKLTDGLGPAELRVRRADGRLVATYRTRGWFADWQWESGRTLLIDVNGTSRSATVRCTAASCERATRTRPAPTSRAAS